MSRKKGLVFLLLYLMGVSGCTATNVQESQQSPKQNLSNDAPGFVGNGRPLSLTRIQAAPCQEMRTRSA